jgi:hypothetical protein
MLGAFIGQNTFDVAARTTATLRPGDYAVVGLDFVTFNSNATASYRSGGGTAPTNKGSVASNGNINLYNSSYINGDARPGIGRTVVGGAGRVSGSTAPLTNPLIYPTADGTAAQTTNNNGSMSLSGADLFLTGSATVPGGTYYIRNLTIEGNGALTFTTAATVWVYGNLTIKGVVQTRDNVPNNLKVNMIPDPSTGTVGTALITSNGALHASLYAPRNAITFAGGGHVYGSVIGKSVSMTGSSDIYFDMALARGAGGQIVQ